MPGAYKHLNDHKIQKLLCEVRMTDAADTQVHDIPFLRLSAEDSKSTSEPAHQDACCLDQHTQGMHDVHDMTQASIPNLTRHALVPVIL